MAAEEEEASIQSLSLFLAADQTHCQPFSRNIINLIRSRGAHRHRGARGLNSNPPISSPSPPPLEFAFLDAVEPTGDPGEELTFPLLSFLEGDTFFSRFDSLGTKLLLLRETKEIGFRIEQSQSQF